MSSFDRRQFLVGSLAASAATLAAAAGSGAIPVGAMPDGLSRLHSAVAISPSMGRAGYLMARALEDRLGRSAPDARYGLLYALMIGEHPVTARDVMQGQFTYALNDLKSRAVLTSGTVQGVSPVSHRGTGSARREADHGIVAMLADRAVAQLISASRTLPE